MPTDATIYRAAGVNAKTAAGYEQLLRNLYVLYFLPTWTNSRIDRLVRAGKRYRVDTWLAGAAAGVGGRAVLEDADLLGRYFDAFGTALLRAEAAFLRARPAPYHLRAEAGRHEVDRWWSWVREGCSASNSMRVRPRMRAMSATWSAFVTGWVPTSSVAPSFTVARRSTRRRNGLLPFPSAPFGPDA